jgi:hypothetical protein
VINLGQFLKIVPYIKQYILKSVKVTQSVQHEPVQAESACATITIDHRKMVVIQVQVGKNFIDDVLINGGSRVNYWKQLENKQEMKASRFMKWNNCIN